MLIGLLVGFYRKVQRADLQSAAGYQPALHEFYWPRRSKVVVPSTRTLE
jgi:hypothetical protein